MVAEAMWWGWGWPAGSNETKANSAQFGLNWGLAGLSLAICISVYTTKCQLFRDNKLIYCKIYEIIKGEKNVPSSPKMNLLKKTKCF